MMLANRLAKIKWQSRRGMLELDLILSKFINTRLVNLNENHLDVFESLLSHTDPELYSLLLGHSISENREENELIELIRAAYQP